MDTPTAGGRPQDRALALTRLVVAASALAAPVACAVLLAERAWLPWATGAALMVGAIGRAVAPTVAVAAVMAVAPVWQVAMYRLTGDTGIYPVIPWLAAAAVTVVESPRQTWHAPGTWRYAVALWGLVVAVTWPAVALRELDFTWQTMSSRTANGAWGSPPAESAAFAAMAAQVQLVALLLCDWYLGASVRTRRIVWWALLPGFAVACALTAYQTFVDVRFLSREPWIRFARGAGTLFDANAMGSLAALLGSALAAQGVAAGTRAGALTGGLTLALSLAAVVSSGSRAALVAWLLAGLALVASAVRTFDWRRVGVAVAVGIAAVGGLAVAAQQYSGTAVPRLLATFESMSAEGPGGLKDVLWNRYGYGPTSMAMIQEHPWVGVGIGVFGVVVADYAKATVGDVLPPDNAQNWWRHQGAELGLLGSVGAFWCSWLVLVAVVRLWRPGGPRLGPAHSAPLLALGVLSVVSPPTQHPIVHVVIALAVAGALAAAWSSETTRAAFVHSRRASVGIWAIAIACIVATTVEGRSAFRPPMRAERFHFRYDYGFFGVTHSPFGEGLWAARDAVGVVGPEGRVLVVTVALPHDDLAQRPVHVEVGDGRRAVCAHDVFDNTPFECRIPTPTADWRIVRLRVSRVWRTEGSTEHAAFVKWRFEP